MTGELPSVTVSLTPQDAELFKLFRQHQDNFQLLLVAGVFDIIAGTVILNFDEHNILRKIEVSSTKYYR